jgi:hypothetical protein
MKKLFLLLFSLAAFSCSKKENLTGTIVNANNGEPVQGVWVMVERFFDRGEEGTVNRIGESVSNAQGRFGMDISSKRMRNKYNIFCPLYYPITEDSIQKAYLISGPDRVELDNEKNQELEFKVIPTVRFKAWVSAKNNYTQGDSLHISTTDPRANNVFFLFPGFPGSSSTSGNSQRAYVPVNNSGKIAVHVYIKRAGKVTEYVDSVKASPFSKVDYILQW